MEEDSRKEEPMTEVETYDLDLSVSRDAGWARCPICNDVWRLGYFVYPWYAVWTNSYDPSNVSKQLQLCPIHMEEIIVERRAKGKRTILDQDQLNEMTENGLHCPVCGRRTLKLIHPRPNTWTCRRCRASVVTDQVATSDGRIEIKYCSFREDLGKRKPEKLPQREFGCLQKGTFRIERM